MKTPSRFHQSERHPLHHVFQHFCTAVDLGTPEEELINILKECTDPIALNSNISLYNRPKNFTQEKLDLPHLPPENISQNLHIDIKTSIQKARMLLSVQAHGTEHNMTIPREQEHENGESQSSTYEVPLVTEPLKTTARSDSCLDDIYKSLERQLGVISSSDGPKRRGRRPRAAAQGV